MKMYLLCYTIGNDMFYLAYPSKTEMEDAINFLLNMHDDIEIDYAVEVGVDHQIEVLEVATKVRLT